MLSRTIAAARYRASVPDLTDVLELVADACQVPMAALKLADGVGAHFVATLGLPETAEVPRSLSLCHLIASGDGTVVASDAARDPRLARHPLVAGAARVRFVGATPLRHEGHIVGALCVFDPGRRRIGGPATRRLLERLARRIDAETGLRDLLAGRPLPIAAGRDDLVRTISHEIRTPLTAIRGNVELLTDTPGAISPAYAGRAEAVARNADRLCRAVDDLLSASFVKSSSFAAGDVRLGRAS